MTANRRAIPIRPMLWLLLAALVPALLSAWLHPRRPVWLKPADVSEVSVPQARSQTDAVWVDTRSVEAFARAHVPGAISLPAGAWETHVEAVVTAWRPGLTVVVYCDAATCDASQSMARRLRDELGLENVHVLAGGWQAWQEATR